MLEMVIDSIRVSLMNYQRVVILKERESDRYLPIWIGSPEAEAIAVKLQNVTPPSPADPRPRRPGDLDPGRRRGPRRRPRLGERYVLRHAGAPGDGRRLEGRSTAGRATPSPSRCAAGRSSRVLTAPNGSSHRRKKRRSTSTSSAPPPMGSPRSARGCLSSSKRASSIRPGSTWTPTPTRSWRRTRPCAGRAGPPLPRAVTEEEVKGMSAFSEFLSDLPGLEELGPPADK